MRPFAILISGVFGGILAVATSSCTVEPHSDFNAKEELAKLEGPDVASIDKTLLSQAQQAANNHDFMRAAEMYKQLSDKNPDKKEYTIAFIDDLRRAGKNTLAMRAVNTALHKYPSDSTLMEIKGLTLMNLGEFAEASKVFGEVMEADSKRWKTLNALGILFAIKKMDPQAIDYYNAALKVSPDNPAVLNNLGLAQAMEKDYDAAIESLTRARNHIENGGDELKHVDLDLALVYAIAGRLDDAEQVAAPHLSKAGLYNNMGFYSYIEKNKDLAKVYLNKALVQDPAYYERAWKNLNAVSGDSSSEANAGNLQHVIDSDAGKHRLDEEEPQASGKTAERKASKKTVKVKTVPVDESDVGSAEDKNKEAAIDLVPPVDVTATPDAAPAQGQGNDSKPEAKDASKASESTLFTPPAASAR